MQNQSVKGVNIQVESINQQEKPVTQLLVSPVFKNQLALRAPNRVLLAENDEKDLLSYTKEEMEHVVEQEDSEEDSDNPHPDLLVSEVI